MQTPQGKLHYNDMVNMQRSLGAWEETQFGKSSIDTPPTLWPVWVPSTCS